MNSDVKKGRVSNHSQRQNFALLWLFYLIMEQNEHEQSSPDPTGQPFLSLSPGENEELISGT